MSSSDQIKDLIRTGKKVGYILEATLEKSISHLPAMDQSYIRNTIEGFKIQIIKSKKDYDELKYKKEEIKKTKTKNRNKGKKKYK